MGVRLVFREMGNIKVKETGTTEQKTWSLVNFERDSGRRWDGKFDYKESGEVVEAPTVASSSRNLT